MICEKPMAVRVEDARRMRDAAAAARGKAMCTFNYRFMPAVRLAKDLIDGGRLGRVYQIRIHYLQMAGHDPSLPPDKVWFSAWPPPAVCRASAATPSTSAASWWAKSRASRPWCGRSTRSGR